MHLLLAQAGHLAANYQQNRLKEADPDIKIRASGIRTQGKKDVRGL